MVNFVGKHPTIFKYNRFHLAGMFGLMKLFGAFLCGLANIFIIMHSQKVADVIKDFVAIGVLIHIDNIIALSANKDKLLDKSIYVDKKR